LLQGTSPVVRHGVPHEPNPLLGRDQDIAAVAGLLRSWRVTSSSRSGARMIALAERFRFLREFQPTMSSARARHAAQQADGPVYDDAVSSYADLGCDDLRAAALEALRARAQP
jgi:hypothetical protein